MNVFSRMQLSILGIPVEFLQRTNAFCIHSVEWAEIPNPPDQSQWQLPCQTQQSTMHRLFQSWMWRLMYCSFYGLTFNKIFTNLPVSSLIVLWGIFNFQHPHFLLYRKFHRILRTPHWSFCSVEQLMPYLTPPSTPLLIPTCGSLHLALNTRDWTFTSEISAMFDTHIKTPTQKMGVFQYLYNYKDYSGFILL